MPYFSLTLFVPALLVETAQEEEEEVSTQLSVSSVSVQFICCTWEEKYE